MDTLVSRRVVTGTVLVLTLLALAVRLHGLDPRDGELSTDEARLTLAAQGVLHTGLPILPSGRLYTRGLVTMYATAPSLAIFGPHDWSARLPSIVMGALLVPVVFLLGRAIGGTVPGFAAAAFIVVCEPLVDWSRHAWPPSAFVLLFILTTYACYRGFVWAEPRWQVWAALGFLATVLAYEFALILPLGLGLYLAVRALRRDLAWWRGRETLATLGIAVVALGVFAAMGLALRAGTMAGADAEFRHYYALDLSPNGLGFYQRQVWGETLPLLILVVAGLVWRRTIERTVPPGLGLLLSMLLVAMLVPTVVIQDKQEVQYGLAALPLIGLLGAWGVAALAQGRHAGPGPVNALIAVGIAVLAFGMVLREDVSSIFRTEQPSTEPTWIDYLKGRGWQPGDLVLAEAPLVTQLYLGRSDFYIHPEGYERYAAWDGSVARSIYTPSVLLHQAGDFERLVAGPNAGRTLWVIGRDERLPRLTRQMDPALWQSLQAASGTTRPRRDWWVMRVELPLKPAASP